MKDVLNIVFPYIVYPLSGILLSAGFTALAIKLLPRFKMIDIPRGRHQHEKAVPLGGGIAVGAAFFITTSLLLLFFNLIGDVAGCRELLELLQKFSIPAAIILITGVLDDRFELSSIVKLVAQIIAGTVFYFTGCGIERLFMCELPAVISFGITVVWCIAIINAFNLIDGLDGVVSGLAAISSFLLALWTIIAGDSTVTAAVLLIFCGCCLGFLRYNFSPAQIFMGDTGSMFLGLFFAYVSMQYSTKAVTLTALMVPLAAIGVPVFDVFLAIWRRTWRKYISKDKNSNIMQGDHDHLHHRILKETGKTGKTALIIYGLSIMLSLLAMVSEFLHSSFPTLVFLVLLVAIFAMIRYSNIELYDTLTSVAKGVNVPHRNFLFAAIHPAVDTVLVLLGVLLSSYLYRSLIPFKWGAWWYLIFTMPFTLVLCFSGIYRTFWVRAGIVQYYKLARLLTIAGIAGYIINGLIWHYSMKLSLGDFKLSSSFYLVFWLLACGLIVSERFIIHYYESFGYRRLFIRNQGRNNDLLRVLIYGGGLECRMYISSVYSSFGEGGKSVRIVGIMDDNPALKKLNIHGFEVFGGSAEISEIYAKKEFDCVVLACELPGDSERMTLLREFCREKKIKIKKFSCTEKDI